MIYQTVNNFFLTAEELENTPSRKDGIDRGTEDTLRVYGCELVQEAGVLLGFPQAAMATGQVLLHRFYCKKSMKDFNIKVRRVGGRQAGDLSSILVQQLRMPSDARPASPHRGGNAPLPRAEAGSHRCLAGCQAGGGA